MKRQHFNINDDTMYMLSVENKGLTECRVGEVYGNGFHCLTSPNKILERNCRQYSQSYPARKELTKKLTGLSAKLPVIIDLFGSIIFFCTHSDRVMENNWFNIKHVHSYRNYNGNTRVRFNNNEEIEVDISFASFNNQYLNALKLHYKFNLEKEKFEYSEMAKYKNSTPSGNYMMDIKGSTDKVSDVSYKAYLQYISGGRMNDLA